MFVVPVAHESNTGRRWPIVSILLIVVNFGIFCWQLSRADLERQAVERLEALHHFVKAHPNVQVDCHAVHLLRMTPRSPSKLRDADDEEARALGNALCEQADQAIFAMPAFRYGDLPGRGGAKTLITHQFLHGGWLHLLFNMWFLWLTACNLEDRWGRVVFPIVYLLSGVAGALLHRSLTSGSFIPLIGASGAIAGAMGAFLVVLATTKIRFFYFVMIVFRPKIGTFDAPAYVMLPLWFALEVLSGFLSPGDGTAHFAHVGGFAFGAVIAAGMRISKVDKRLDEAIEKKSTFFQDPRIIEAGRLLDEGRVAESVDAFNRLAAEMPGSIDVRLGLLRASGLARDLDMRATALVDLALLYVEEKELQGASALVAELHQMGIQDRAPPAKLQRLGERFVLKGALLEAGQSFTALYKGGMRSEHAVRGAVAHAALLLRQGLLDEAWRLLDAASKSEHVPPDAAQKIDAMFAQVRARAAGPPRAEP